MPRAEILSKQAIHTLTQLHAELAGKIETNRKSGDRLQSQMVQVEAVVKMLSPDFNVSRIAPSAGLSAIPDSSAARCLESPWM
jgi:hypothetical protein